MLGYSVEDKLSSFFLAVIYFVAGLPLGFLFWSAPRTAAAAAAAPLPPAPCSLCGARCRPLPRLGGKALGGGM